MAANIDLYSKDKNPASESTSTLSSSVQFFYRMLFWLYSLWQAILNLLKKFWRKYNSPILTLDSGVTVQIGEQIAQGGFSVVWHATDCTQEREIQNRFRDQSYALKRLYVPDRELYEQCLKEAQVHRKLSAQGHCPYLMPLLGTAHQQDYYYMLFPYYPHSLRQILNRYYFSDDFGKTTVSLSPFSTINQQDQPQASPWNETAILEVFYKICQAVNVMHQNGYAHNDIKPENILFGPHDDLSCRTPVLMDFGSVATPLRQSLDSRRDVVNLVDRAEQHTTLPYRPPELLSGGVRQGDPFIDLTRVDVWSLGCTLFAMMFGTSPWEAEFITNNSNSNRHLNNNNILRVVECTHLKIIGDLIRPPAHSPLAQWYSTETWQLLEQMLDKDRHQRLDLPTVLSRLRDILKQRGSSVDTDKIQSFEISEHDYDGEESALIHQSLV